MRWTKWIVRAKSGTSLLRAIRSKMGITLSSLACHSSRDISIVALRDDRVQHPAEGECPASSHVSSYSLPVKEHGRLRMLARDKGREDDQHNRAHVVGQLEQEDLGEDAQRSQVCQRAWTRWTSSTRHDFVGTCTTVSSVVGYVL